MAESALCFSEVTKVYVRPRLGRTYRTLGVEEINLKIAPGEIFGLLGLAGSGKTTALKLALGLLRPSLGTVTLFGDPAGSPQSLSKIGYLPQLPYFYPRLTPLEVLRFYGKLSGMPSQELDRRVKLALERVGLPAHAGRKMSDFSRGMIQRVGLAQAILHDPKLLILDEPVNGLDPLAVAEIREIIRRLNGDGITIFLSSHAISEAEKLCTRVGILADGRLVRLLDRKLWQQEPGLLEGLFVQTVNASLERR